MHRGAQDVGTAKGYTPVDPLDPRLPRTEPLRTRPALKCENCGSEEFIYSPTAKQDDARICRRCQSRSTYGQIVAAAAEEAAQELVDADSELQERARRSSDRS